MSGSDGYTVLARERLHQLIWSAPLQHLATEIGISNVGLAKVCRSARVPTPWQGYWNQQPSNREPAEQLPRRELCQLQFIGFKGTLPAHLQHLEDPYEVAWENISAMEGRFRRALGRITCPALSRGRVATSIWRLMDREMTRRRKGYYSVTPPRFELPWERRKLRLINGILLAIERTGGRGEVRGEDADQVVLDIGDLDVTLTIGHSEVKSRHLLSISTGKTSWRDEPDHPLEQRLSDIVVAVAVATELEYRS